MAAASSTHPSPGGNHAKGNQEQPYSEYHIVFHARMIAFGHDAQPERGSKRADCACIPPSSFPYADGEYRTDGYAQERRDRSPAVHVCLPADRAVGIIMRLTHPGVHHCQRARRTGPVTCGVGHPEGTRSARDRFRETSIIPRWWFGERTSPRTTQVPGGDVRVC